MIHTRHGGLLENDRIVSEVTNRDSTQGHSTYDPERTFVEWNFDSEVVRVINYAFNHYDGTKKINLWNSEEFAEFAQRCDIMFQTSVDNERSIIELGIKVRKLEEIIHKAGLDKEYATPNPDSEQRKIVV